MNLFKKIVTWVCRILGITVLIIIFFWLVHPLLTRFIIPPLSVHRKISQYTSGQYKQYEDGELFANFTESFSLIENGEIVAFYHVNHWLQDNPIHGKQCDFFALDVRLAEGEYAQAKALQIECCGKPYIERDFYVWEYGNNEDKNAYFLGFCDDSCIVKFVLVTETYASDFLPAGFYLNSEIDWKSPIGE